MFTVDDIGEKIPTLSDNYTNMPHIKIKTEDVDKSGFIKATGFDEIPACILKEYAHELVHHLDSLYNTSLSRGKVPPDWR